MSNLVQTIKMIAQEAAEDSKPTGIIYATVITVSPLRIQVDAKLTLEENNLVLTNNVKDHYVDITVNHLTVADNHLNTTHSHPDAGSASFDSTHDHAYRGRKKIMLHYGLQVGEKVILIREQGGQKYIVLDRIETPITEGEWV